MTASVTSLFVILAAEATFISCVRTNFLFQFKYQQRRSCPLAPLGNYYRLIEARYRELQHAAARKVPPLELLCDFRL